MHYGTHAPGRAAVCPTQAIVLVQYDATGCVRQVTTCDLQSGGLHELGPPGGAHGYTEPSTLGTSQTPCCLLYVAGNKRVSVMRIFISGLPCLLESASLPF